MRLGNEKKQRILFKIRFIGGLAVYREFTKLFSENLNDFMTKGTFDDKILNLVFIFLN